MSREDNGMSMSEDNIALSVPQRKMHKTSAKVRESVPNSDFRVNTSKPYLK